MRIKTPNKNLSITFSYDWKPSRTAPKKMDGVIHDLRVTTCKIRLMKNDDDREGTIVSEATVTRNAKESDCKWKARREALRQALELAEMTFGNPVGIGPGAVKTPHYNRTERAEIWKQYFAKVSH